ncbi:putative ribonuclease h protein, partial [Nicotiana attenuata]
LPYNQPPTSISQLLPTKSEVTLQILDTLDTTQTNGVKPMHVAVNQVTSDVGIPQNPCKPHDDLSREYHHDESTILSPSITNIYPSLVQTLTSSTPIPSEAKQLPHSLLHAETNIHKYDLESVSEGKLTDQQPIFPPSSSHNGRSSTASEHITPDIHVPGNDHRYSSPILVGNGIAGICSSFYAATQQPGGGTAHTEPNSSSRNSDRRDEVGNGSLQPKSVVHDPNSSSNGSSGFQLYSSTLALSVHTDESNLGSHSKSTSFLSTSSYGSGLCSLVSRTGLLQSTLPLFESIRSTRESNSTSQSSALTYSISTRTRQGYKRGINSNTCGDERDANGILVVKRDSVLQPQRTIRKKIHSKGSSGNDNMQPQFPSDNQSRGWKICHGHHSNTSSTSTEGSHNAEFRRHFRFLLDNHKPTLAILLETHMHDHTSLREDFNFTNMAQAPANGLMEGCAKTYWQTLGILEFINYFSQETHASNWVHNLITCKDLHFSYKINPATYLSLSLWNIWVARNNNCYRHIISTASTKLTTQQAAEFTYLVAKKHTIRKKRQQNLKRKPPKLPFYKLNTDGAHNNSKSGIGGLIRNANAEWILGFAASITTESPSTAETHALIQGLQLVLDRNLLPLEVEVDSKDIIRLLNSDKEIPNNLISDCRYLLDRLGKPIVLHAYREQNGVADKLAKEGCNFDIQSMMHIFEDSPDFARSLFEQEKSVVQEHVLDHYRPHSSTYSIINTYCNSGRPTCGSTIVGYNTLAPATGAYACNRMQCMHQASVRNL